MMLKFLQATFKSIFAIASKLLLINELDQLRTKNEELILKNHRLFTEKTELIRENYRLSQNLSGAIASIQDLQEQLIRYQSAQPEMPLSLDETFDSNDLATINQLIQEINSDKHTTK